MKYSGKKGCAKRGEQLKETEIVYTLITRLEITRLQTEVDKIDKKAFMVMHSIKDAKGGNDQETEAYQYQDAVEIVLRCLP